jgi:hypothetical protein
MNPKITGLPFMWIALHAKLGKRNFNQTGNKVFKSPLL